MINNIRIAANTCTAVAKSLSERGKYAPAIELRRIAQQLMDGMGSGPGSYGQSPLGGSFANSSQDSGQDLMGGSEQAYDFDPSQDVKVGVQELRSDANDNSQGGLHPEINTFVKPPTDQPSEMVDDRKTHQLSCTLKAPDGVSEADMMNYILGIGDALKVDVDSFKWSKTEPKSSSGAR